MIWLKAIWIHVKAAVSELISAAIICAIMMVGICAVGAVVFGIGWVINYFAGATGVMYSVFGIFIILAVVMVIMIIRDSYHRIKATKERLEKLEKERSM